ncbi:MAG: protein-(glutamine-N5) methyltransferase, release factor-specific [Bdellovibrionales bacterium RIFOXYB2_FULL_36_6]|nr:MAG: protein-(glutamine-N5) methyltransferase, release factor-specific [Bdellovibrionales bacterium RIFOXYB2_FULL_36_6]
MTQTVKTITDKLCQYLSMKGITNSKLETDLILTKALNCNRIQLYCSYDYPLNNIELQVIRQLARRRARHEPMAYILGEKEFRSMSYYIDRRVLIPRPETELVIELLERYYYNEKYHTAVDIGTGSGILAINCSILFKSALVIATDISYDALEVALINIKKHRIQNVRLLMCNKLQCIKDNSVELVISNPPYIRTYDLDELSYEIKSYEPRIALDGGQDGMIKIREILTDATRVCSIKGIIIIEIGKGQRCLVEEWVNESRLPLKLDRVGKDLVGIDRVLCYRKEECNG